MRVADHTYMPSDPHSQASSPLPPGYRMVYSGDPLPPFYAAEMIRPYIGKTILVRDSGGRSRCGMVISVPNLKEETPAEGAAPVEFEDERPLYLRGITFIAVYEAKRQR